MALLGSAAVTSGLLGSAQAGKTITVGLSGCDFTAIQAAIDAAPNGSIIQVQTGSYKENLTIRNRDGLTLQGAGAEAVTLDGNGPQQKDVTPGILILSSRNITVAGLRITNSWVGLEADDTRLLFVEANAFEANLQEGIYLLRSEARIAENVVRGTQRDLTAGIRGDGIWLAGSCRATLLNNVVTENADCGLRTEIEAGQDPPQVTGSGNTIAANRGGDLSGDLPISLLSQPLPEGTEAEVRVPADVPTIQMAVDRVQSGGTIRVAAGTYVQPVQSGPVQIYKSLKILGAGADKTVLQAPGPEWVAVNIATDGLEVTLEGLTVTGGRRGVQVNTGSTSSVVLRNVVLERNGAGKSNDFGLRISGDSTATLYQTTIARNEGIGLSASAGQPKVAIQNSTIVDNSSYGLVLHSAASATIEGSTVSRNGSRGVALYEESRISLVNCTISDNVITGLGLSNSSQATVTNSRFTGTRASGDALGYGILAVGDSRVTAEKNTISQNAGFGIYLWERTVSTIRGNTISDNSNYGLYLRGSASATIEGNTISRNVVTGIGLRESAQATITGNQITGAKASGDALGYGILAIGESRVTAEKNTISQNAGFGVYLWEKTVSTIRGNTISDNGNCGVYLRGTATATIEDNAITGNIFAGVRLYDSAEATITNNRINDNKPDAQGNYGRAISLDQDSHATIRGNTMTGNALDAVRLLNNAQATITGNTITKSGRHGINIGDHGTVTNEAAKAEISNNTIQNSGGCGVSVDSDPGISIAGRDNKISGNTGGQLCGTASKFPKGFGGGR
jgi:parallel beta-helix repeat protein